MFADRIESKWIEAFKNQFALCGVQAGDPVAILSESQSRQVNVHLSELALWANVTIAIPRGVLLKVAGWSAVKTVMGAEPWYIGGIFGLFLLGASTTKDFADMEGDRRGGCRTLPIVYGVKRAAWMISPSFVVPFLLINVGAAAGVLTGHAALLHLLGGIMTTYGLYVCYLMLKRPEDLAVEENHVSWAHMYRMMFVAQVGFALAYIA